MVGVLAVLFVVTPIVELALLIRLGGAIGVGWTVALVLATGVAGAWFARREGLRTMRELTQLLARGVLPGQQILDGLAIFAGGALLLTPGLVTDALGFLLLLPPTRAMLQQLATRYLRHRLQMHQVIITASRHSERRHDINDTIVEQTFGPDDERIEPPEPTRRGVDGDGA